MSNGLPDIPHNMRKAYRRFQQWRSAHTGRSPIPGPLWAAAVELAREHGVFQTAKSLRLEYGKLRHLVEPAGPMTKGRVVRARATGPRRPRSNAPPAFVELMASQAVGVSEFLIELEGRRGKMRIQ